MAARLRERQICCYAATSEREREKKGRLTIQCDELWSFVSNKGNKQWVWLAIDTKTREVVGVHIGDRSETGAKALWQSLPPMYRQFAVCYTDFWGAYAAVLPSKRHRAVGKEMGLTIAFSSRAACPR